MHASTALAGPLDGLRVLDLGHLLAGPFAATLLGDFGADVIKVERPGAGDAVRSLGPKNESGAVWWKSLARNKRSVALDWTAPDGREMLKRLVESADVLIENFRPGVLERNGLGPEQLHAWNERLVILRISGYGQSGPYSLQPGFGKAAEAFSGVVHLTGLRGGTPMHAGFPMGDMTSGLMGAFGVVLALLALERGLVKGQVIDLPIYETPLRLVDYHIPVFTGTGEVTQRNGNQQPMALGFSGIFQSRDRKWITFTAGTMAVARRVLRLIGGEGLADDPRFADIAAVSRHADELSRLVELWMGERTASDVLAAFEGADAVAALVYDAADIVADPHIQARGNVVSVGGDPVQVVGVVPKLSATPGSIRWLGPERVGQHTDEVLAELMPAFAPAPAAAKLEH